MLWIQGFWIGEYSIRDMDSLLNSKGSDSQKDNPFTIPQPLKMKAVYTFETPGINSLATRDREVGRLIKNLISPDSTFI
jgi:hypothetical protein